MFAVKVKVIFSPTFGVELLTVLTILTSASGSGFGVLVEELLLGTVSEALPLTEAVFA